MSLRVSLNWEIFPVVICQTSAGPSGGVGRRQLGRKGKGVSRYRNRVGKDLTMTMCIVY